MEGGERREEERREREVGVDVRGGGEIKKTII